MGGRAPVHVRRYARLRDDGNRPSAQDARRRAETAVATQQDRATRDAGGGQVDVRARPPSGGSIQAGQPEREGNPAGSVRETIRSGPAGRFCHQTGDEPPEHGVPPAPARAVSWLRPLPAAGAARDRGHGLQPRCREAQTQVSGLRGGVQRWQLFRCGQGVSSLLVSRGAKPSDGGSARPSGSAERLCSYRHARRSAYDQNARSRVRIVRDRGVEPA